MKRKLFREKKVYSDFLVLSAVEVDYRWFAIGAFIEQDKPFEQWRYESVSYVEGKQHTKDQKNLPKGYLARP